jgi:hypothetical protein
MTPQRIELPLDPVHPLPGVLGWRLLDATVYLLEGLGKLLHFSCVPHHVGVEVALHVHSAVGANRDPRAEETVEEAP